MNKLNKLCAILFAVLGVTTLKAQTNIIADWDGGSNTGKPTTFGWASSYGSRSWGELNGGGARVTNNYSGYKLEDGSTYSYSKDSEPSTQILWIRYESNKNETYTYTFTGLEAGKVYTFSGLVGWHNNSNAPTFTIAVNGDKELAKVSKYVGKKQTLYPFSVDFMVPADNQSENFTLTFKSNQGGDNIEALSALSIVESSAFANASQETPYDMTSWLQDPSFENNGSGWVMTTTYTNWGANAITGDAGKLNKQQWNGNFEVTQTLSNIPNGAYRLSVQGFYRPGGNEATSTAQNAILYANDSETALMLVSAGGKDTQDAANGFTTAYTGVTPNVFVPNNQNDASKVFSTGAYSDNIVKVNVTNNTIKLGVKKEIHIGNDWTVIDNFKLEYLGYDLSEALNALNALVTTAQGIIDADEVSPQSVLRLQAAIEAANSVQQTEEAIAEASTALTEAINAANATIAACNEYRSMLALSESMYTNSTADDKSTFEAAINQAKSDFNAATSIDAISAIVTDLQNAQKAYCLVATPAEGHPFDMTFLIVNPKFDEGTEGWTHTTGAPNWGIATNQGGAITGNFFENWKWESYTGDIYQEITGLPNGKYRLTVAAFRDQLIDGASDGDAVYVFANDMETLVNAAAPAFYTVEVTTTTGSLKFGVRSKVAKYRWMGIDNATLLFVAGLDLSEFEAAYNTALEAAIATRDNADYKSVAGIERTNLVNAINLTVEETKESYMEATSALNEATAVFIAAKSDYETLNSEITIAKGLGMTDAAINAITNNNTGAKAYTDLKVAEYNYIQKTYTESATLGSWTETFAEDLDGEGYKIGGPKYLNEWGNATRTAKQIVKLPAGDYAISSIGRGQVGTSGYLYYKIGETTNKVDFIMKGNRGRGVDVNGVANFSGDGEYNCNNEGFGWEYRFITFHLDAETEVEIGVSATFANAWVSIYAPELLTTEASVKALRLSEIATALGNVPTGKMDASIQDILNNAVTDAEEVTSASTIDELNSASTALTEAINNAKASVAEYAQINTYIEKADNIDASIAAGYKSQYENGSIAETAINVFQSLEVATYNYVTEEFSYPVALSGEWTTEGPVGELSDQHWSGEKRPYMEQSSAAWGWDAWSISYDQDLTLPAGEYVFKVAGRKAAGDGCTLELIVTKGDETLGTVNDFPGGDTGLGINKNGVTSFDANDEAGFANNNAGRAWQWRYVKFTLDSEATVNIAVNAKATTNHQWISFCDATVQMTEETYLAANMSALDAPTAAAEALVDSKPMGTAENQALKDALAWPVTTGAELKAKIEALNTAVANANAWVVEYNNAKAPLVAAMERFELRFNGEDGCVFAIGNEEWAELLEAVKSAALAKDETNSYGGFEQAAADLNAAMDKAEMYPTENKKSATATDMSNYYLVNPSFDEGNTNGWEFSGSQTNPVTRNVADGTFTATPTGSHYTGDAIWQKVTLAEGAYKLSANVNAGEVRGYSSQLFVAKSAPAWNNVLNDVVKTVTVTEFNKDVELTCVFSVEEKTEVYIGFNQTAGNVAGTDVYASYNVYGFTLKQAVNQIHSENGVITVVGENEAEDVAGVQGDNNIVTVDLTGATWAEGSTLTLVNKNALVYVADGANINAGNVVKNGVSESIVLTDGYNFNAREGFTADAVSYNRTFAQGTWLSVCVPFDFTIPEGVKVETLGEVDVDGKVFTFNEVTDKMEANKPYIIKNSTENAALFAALESVDVKATPADMTTAVEGAEFGSTYRTVTSTELMEDDAYDILFFGTDGQLYYLTEGSKAITFKPFRSYIRVERGRINWSDGVAARVRHSSDDFTGIDEVETDEEGEVVIYDLMGRRVNTMQKGSIYIINGKKVLNK